MWRELPMKDVNCQYIAADNNITFSQEREILVQVNKGLVKHSLKFRA